MNTIYYVRNGENPANLTSEFSYKNRLSAECSGCSASPTNSSVLPRQAITAVYSSPLKRALQTAQIIAQPLHLPVLVRKQFREINVGLLEDQPPTAETWAIHDRIFADWFSGKTDICFPSGEDHVTLLHRIRDRLQEALRRRIDQHIIVVGHSDILAACLSHLCNNIDLREVIGVHIPNCAITLFEVAEQQKGQLRGRLIALATCHHLSNTDYECSAS